MNLHRCFSGAAAIAVLASCGSAGEALTFKAPAGYTSVMSLGPFMQMWRGPNQGVLMLMAMPTEIDLDKAVSSSDVRDAEIQKKATIRICGGGQQAVYVSMIGERDVLGSPAPGSNAEKRQIDFLATNANGKTYMAMYMRPLGTPQDPAAEGAIHEICPK
ncbi:MAG TPA: hypothetical protein VMF11_03775 [Candidatus Baltobacteraceae bacterium]|nr:hypothetical protein [Candidatus Baltobacteraceae bacterium]